MRSAPPSGAQDDPEARVHHANPRLARRVAGLLPLDREAPEEIVRRRVRFRDPGVAAVAVVAERRRRDEHAGPLREPSERLGQEPRRPDSARAQERLALLGEAPAGDVRAGQVDDTLDAFEHLGVDQAPVRVPVDLAPARGAAAGPAAAPRAPPPQARAPSAVPTSPLAPVTATRIQLLRLAQSCQNGRSTRRRISSPCRSSSSP